MKGPPFALQSQEKSPQHFDYLLCKRRMLRDASRRPRLHFALLAKKRHRGLYLWRLRRCVHIGRLAASNIGRSLLVLGTRRKAQPPMQLRQHLGCRASSHGRSSRSLPLRQPACAICSAKALHKAQHLKKPDQHSLLELLPRCIRSSDFSDLSHREHSDTGPPIIPKVA